MLSPYGKRELRRTLEFGLLGLAALTAITVATDEVGAGLGERSARIGALGPMVGALAAAAARARSRSTGEARALQSLGGSSWQAFGGACCAGWLLGALGLILALGPWSQPAALFPQLDSGREWLLLPSGGLLHSAGVSWTQAGGFAPTAASASTVGAAAAPTPAVLAGSAQALMLLVPSALVLPPWALSLSLRPAALAGSAAGLLVSAWLTLALVHLAAAGVVGFGWTCFGPVPLLLDAAIRNATPGRRRGVVW